ncbi:unnamed protein product [Ectocarpus sp. CCAP 1310/34]|nr:unnamed protein product [Ectocarpus sp. CCAP 1310/34]
MDASDASLLDERSRDSPTLLPALQNLLQLVTPAIPMTKSRLQAVMGISTMVQRVRIEPSSFGPLLPHSLQARHGAKHQDAGNGRCFCISRQQGLGYQACWPRP